MLVSACSAGEGTPGGAKPSSVGCGADIIGVFKAGAAGNSGCAATTGGVCGSPSAVCGTFKGAGGGVTAGAAFNGS